MTEARFRIGEDRHLPRELLRVPKIVLVAERKKIGAALTRVERRAQAAPKIRVDADASVVLEEVDRPAGEAPDRIANVLALRAVSRDDDLNVLMFLRKERFKLTRQKLKVGPIKAKDDEDTAIKLVAQEP